MPGTKFRISLHWQAVQRWLDGLAALAMIGTSITLAWFVYLGAAQTPTRAPARLPAEPISLAGAPTLGSSEAKVAIVEFSDFQCPFCGSFARETLPALKRDYVTTGLVQLAFRNLPLTQIHKRAWRAAEAAECAAKQKQFWQMHDLIFSNPTSLEDDDFHKRASTLGMNSTAFEQCMKGEAQARVSADTELAQSLRVTGTPSFLIGLRQSDGLVKIKNVLTGAAGADEFKKVLDALLTVAATSS